MVEPKLRPITAVTRRSDGVIFIDSVPNTGGLDMIKELGEVPGWEVLDLFATQEREVIDKTLGRPVELTVGAKPITFDEAREHLTARWADEP